MRILHARSEIAGQQGLIAKMQRELGHHALSYAIPHVFAYDPGPDVTPPSGNPFLRRFGVAKFAAAVPFRFDVVHFHGGSFLPPRFRAIDAACYHSMRRKTVIQFWGSEARLDSVEELRNPFYVPHNRQADAAKKRMLSEWARITEGHVIFADHAFDRTLNLFFDHVHVLRQAVDTHRLAPKYPRSDATTPVVVHAPSRPELKGTDHVRRAIEILRHRGLRFRYLEMTGTSHAEAINAVARADIVVDQLILGSHGILAAEAMALGKPVICYILPELVPTYPEGFPIINANPATFVDVLAEWLEDPERRTAAGRSSRSYAEAVHEARVVAKEAISLYEQLP